MNLYQNSHFSGETIDLDGCAFRGCSFSDCTLRFSAAGPLELSGCRFENSRLAPAGAAQLTLDYLRGFYHGLGEWGRDTVDGLIDQVRRVDQLAPPHAGVAPGPDREGSDGEDIREYSYRQALEAFGASAEGHAIVAGFERLPAERRRQIAELIRLAAHRSDRS